MRKTILKYILIPLFILIIYICICYVFIIKEPFRKIIIVSYTTEYDYKSNIIDMNDIFYSKKDMIKKIYEIIYENEQSDFYITDIWSF